MFHWVHSRAETEERAEPLGEEWVGKHQTLSVFLVKKTLKGVVYVLCERKALKTGIEKEILQKSG